MDQVREYELLYIIRPDLDEDDRNALTERFDKIIEDNGGEISNSRVWSKRRFAYEIEDYNEGTYYLVDFSTSSEDALNEFDRLAGINDDILRHMIVRREDRE